MDTPTQGVAVDISDSFQEDSTVLTITKPGANDDERIPTSWKITLAGPTHPNTIAYNEEQHRIALRERAAQEQTAANGRKVKIEAETPEEAKARTLRMLKSRILSWTPVVIAQINGEEPIVYPSDAADKLLASPGMGWAIAQVIEVLTSERGFMKRSAKT